MADTQLHNFDRDDAPSLSREPDDLSFYDETIARSVQKDTPKTPPSGGGKTLTRPVEPDIEAAGRRSDMPDGMVYDTSMIEGTGPSNFWVLGLVLLFIALLLGVFVFALYHFRFIGASA